MIPQFNTFCSLIHRLNPSAAYHNQTLKRDFVLLFPKISPIHLFNVPVMPDFIKFKWDSNQRFLNILKYICYRAIQSSFER